MSQRGLGAKGKKIGKRVDLRARTDRDFRIRTSILNTAADLVLEHGYEAVSVEAIIKKAGGSKTNVYRQFGDKEGLLYALVEYESERLRRPLEQLDLSGLSLRDALEKIAKAYLLVVYDKRTVALHRLVIAQGGKFPRLATTFVRNGPEGAVHTVSKIISRWKRERVLIADRDPNVLARQFLDLLKIKTHAQLLIGIQAGSTKDRQAAIADGIETFLYGICGRSKSK